MSEARPPATDPDELLEFLFRLAQALLACGEQTATVELALRRAAAFWGPWLGVVVFGIGAYIHFSAPRNSLPWLLLVLLVAFGAQQAAATVFGKTGSGFFGMLAVTPLSYLIHLRFRGPPAMVTFLPSFWLLVPGGVSLLSVTKMLSDRSAGIDGLVTTVFVFVSIALGTLMGAAVYKLLTEHFNAWQLQLGRVGRYFRRQRK